LMDLSDVDRLIGLHKEGIKAAKEALEMYERLGDAVEQARCLVYLARLLHSDKQFEAAEEAAFCAISLLPKKGEEHQVCHSHRILGDVYRSKGEKEKSIHHFETSLEIASSFNWQHHLFWVHHKLAELFLGEGRFDDAHVYVGRAKSHAVDSAYRLCYAMELQANIWYKQRKFEQAKSEALRAADVYEKFGNARNVERCRKLLLDIQRELNDLIASVQPSGFNCKLL